MMKRLIVALLFCSACCIFSGAEPAGSLKATVTRQEGNSVEPAGQQRVMKDNAMDGDSKKNGVSGEAIQKNTNEGKGGTMTHDAKKTLILSTFNIRIPVDPSPNDWPSRFPRIQRLLSRHHVEIAGLQEVTKLQLDDFLAAGGWGVVCITKEQGLEDGEHPCIIYQKDRFSVEQNGAFWLSETPGIPASRSWNTTYPRLCIWARFADKASGRSFFYFNIHLDHIAAEAQYNGLKLVLEKIAGSTSGCPVVLTGDFNVFPDSQAIALAEGTLRNGYKVTLAPRTLPLLSYHHFKGHDFSKERPDMRILDYIFVNDSFRVRDIQICDETENGLYPSDHFPVIAELELP